VKISEANLCRRNVQLIKTNLCVEEKAGGKLLRVRNSSQTVPFRYQRIYLSGTDPMGNPFGLLGGRGKNIQFHHRTWQH
jgi:hypothetical protein